MFGSMHEGGQKVLCTSCKDQKESWDGRLSSFSLFSFSLEDAWQYIGSVGKMSEGAKSNVTREEKGQLCKPRRRKSRPQDHHRPMKRTTKAMTQHVPPPLFPVFYPHVYRFFSCWTQAASDRKLPVGVNKSGILKDASCVCDHTNFSSPRTYLHL